MPSSNGAGASYFNGSDQKQRLARRTSRERVAIQGVVLDFHLRELSGGNFTCFGNLNDTASCRFHGASEGHCIRRADL